MALKYGLIDGELADRVTALHEIGLVEEPPVVEGPWVEKMIQQLLAREWLPRLLVVLGFMALMIEMGTPGLGAGGFVAALCFLAFFWLEGLHGNVEWLDVELFVLPGFGLFGIGGIIMVLASIVLASQTFVLPSNSEQLSIIASNLFWVAICGAICMVGLVVMGKRLENTPVIRWVTIEPGGTDDASELEQREAIVHWEHLLGQDGITTTRLNPSGKAQFGRMIVNVLGTNLIDEGVAVRVVEVEPIE
jgi:membrane-bound ClpP family serine protease